MTNGPSRYYKILARLLTTISVLSIIYSIFALPLSLTVGGIIHLYKDLLSALLGWLQPALVSLFLFFNSVLPFELQLSPHWKDWIVLSVGVIGGIYSSGYLTENVSNRTKLITIVTCLICILSWIFPLKHPINPESIGITSFDYTIMFMFVNSYLPQITSVYIIEISMISDKMEYKKSLVSIIDVIVFEGQSIMLRFVICVVLSFFLFVQMSAWSEVMFPNASFIGHSDFGVIFTLILIMTYAFHYSLNIPAIGWAFTEGQRLWRKQRWDTCKFFGEAIASVMLGVALFLLINLGARYLGI